MPEVLEEFFNGDVDMNQLSAGHTILSNTADQRAVVRDVSFALPTLASNPVNLIVGGTVVSSLSSSGTLAGAEIIGPSSSLIVQSQVTPILNRVFKATNSQSQDNFCRTLFSNNDLSVSSQFTHSPITNYSTSFPINPYQFVPAGSDVYFGLYANGSSSNSFYRRAGGVSGAETNLSSGIGLIWAYDGFRYIYGLKSGPNRITTYDTQTNTMGTPVTLTGPSFSFTSASTCAAIDGRLIFSDQASSSWNLVINPQTGASVAISGAASVGTNSYTTHMEVAKTLTGDYIFARLNSSSQTLLENIGPNLDSPSVVSYSTITETNYTSYSSSSKLMHRPQNNNNFLVIFSTNFAIMRIIDVSTMTMTSSNISLNTVAGTSPLSASGASPILDSTVAAADFGNTRVRATGVRIT